MSGDGDVDNDIQMAAAPEPNPATTLMPLDEIEARHPEVDWSEIRVDQATQKVSVIDVIKTVCKKNGSAANQTFTRLGDEFVTKCERLRINGKGKLTPVCDTQTAVEVVRVLPGKAAKSLVLHLLERGQRSEDAFRDLVAKGSTVRAENGVRIEISGARSTVAAVDGEEAVPERTKLMETFSSLPKHLFDADADCDGTEQFVYFIGVKGEDMVKVGVSVDPHGRLLALQTGCPLELVLLRVIPAGAFGFLAENTMHTTLREKGKHLRGEWFALTEKEAEEIDIDTKRTSGVPGVTGTKRQREEDDASVPDIKRSRME